MKIILIGPPGAGKGTQAKYICNEFSIPSISTGDILRQYTNNNHPLGIKAAEYMRKGELIPDPLIIDIISNRLRKKDCQHGYILDGFPRSINQCHSLFNSNIKIDLVFELKIELKEVINRLSGRRIHPESGRTYHIKYNPPKNQGVDDLTNEPLIQRDDDKKETIMQRLHVFNNLTKPVAKFLQEKINNSYYFIDANLDPVEINKAILDIIKNYKKNNKS